MSSHYPTRESERETIAYTSQQRSGIISGSSSVFILSCCQCAGCTIAITAGDLDEISTHQSHKIMKNFFLLSLLSVEKFLWKFFY